jgi:hypothetical protein
MGGEDPFLNYFRVKTNFMKEEGGLLWEKRTGGALAVLEAEKHHHKMFMFLLFD